MARLGRGKAQGKQRGSRGVAEAHLGEANSEAEARPGEAVPDHSRPRIVLDEVEAKLKPRRGETWPWRVDARQGEA